MTGQRMYTTPEGFDLYKPLLLPDVRDFTDVLTATGPWDFATMGHRNGEPLPDHPADVVIDGQPPLGRFCALRSSTFPQWRNLVVAPGPALLDEITRSPREAFSFFDRVGFKAMYHPRNDRVLIVADAQGLLVSRWVAYVDPATVPVFP